MRAITSGPEPGVLGMTMVMVFPAKETGAIVGVGLDVGLGAGDGDAVGFEVGDGVGDGARAGVGLAQPARLARTSPVTSKQLTKRASCKILLNRSGVGE